MGDKGRTSKRFECKFRNPINSKKDECLLALKEHGIRWQKSPHIVLDGFGFFSGLNCIEIGPGSRHYFMLFARLRTKVPLGQFKNSKMALDFYRGVCKDSD